MKSKDKKARKFIESHARQKAEVGHPPDILNHFYFKLLAIILISGLGIIAYSNTFHCPFHFDDDYYITNDPSIQNIHNLPDIWKVYPYRFVTFLSIALNYHFNRFDVFGYHLFNLAVHLISAILVWWLVLLTFSAPAVKKETISEHANLIALLAGLVFVSHPIQTEAVTYIWQRTASMAAMFYVGTLCLYVQSRLLEDNRSSPGLRKFYYFCSLLTAIVAMFTKEMTVTLPFMILLYEYCFFKTKKSLNWKYIVPFFIALLIIALTALLLPHAIRVKEMEGVISGVNSISPLHYFLTQFRVIVTYIRLLFLPINQNLDYDYHVSQSLFELPTLISFLFLAGILYFAKRLFSKYRLLSFSIFWFFLTLLPESSVVPLKDVIFEHRLYLPMVGYGLFLVSGVYYLLGKRSMIAMVAALTMIVGFNSILTYQRNKVWRDEFALWDDAARKSPHKARPLYNRGNIYAKQGNFTQAMSDYNEAIEINPEYGDAYNNRGLIYDKQGNPAQAISDYNKAVESNPVNAEAYANRGLAYVKQNNFSQAISDFTRAIEINPGYAEAYSSRGLAEDKQGNPAQAISDYNKAIELNPKLAEAYKNRGLINYRQGKITQAVSDFNIAIEMDPKDAMAYNTRAVIYDKMDNFTQTISDLNKAIEIDPQYAEAYTNLGYVYDQEGNFTQAISDYDKAIEINPRYAEAYYNRGVTCNKQGNPVQAISTFTKAIEIDPGYIEAYINRGVTYAQQDNFAQAISDFTQVIDINPKEPEVYNNRAISYYRLKEYDKAWGDVHKAEELGTPVSPGLINALSQVAASGGTPGQDK